MPLTRSQDKKSEAWTVDVERPAAGLRHQMPPRSPTTTGGTEHSAPIRSPSASRMSDNTPTQENTEPQEHIENLEETSTCRKAPRREGASDRTLKPSNRTQSMQDSMATRGDTRIESSRPPSTNKTTRSHRKISKAREDLLKIRLELAELALQTAEEEVSDAEYMDDRDSNEEYVRSWLEEAPEPEPLKEDDADRLGPQPAAVNAEATSRAHDAHPHVKKVKADTEPPRRIEAKDSLRPFLTELTTAIASLADRKIEPWTPGPSASKAVMTLPNFGGAHTEWLSFRAIYQATCAYFSDIENTARLRRSLRGRALETVSSELIGNAKPDEIMRELELQYGRPDSIAQAETDRLRGLPRCSESPKDICTFASRVRSGVVTLRALKKDHYLINAELMRMLTEKLPNSLRVQWYRTYTEKYQSLPDLSLFSDYITEQAHFCSAFAPPENIKETDTQVGKRVIQRTHTATDKPVNKCRVCDKGGHYSSDCSKFRDAAIDKKWELAKSHSLCYRCLRFRREGHTCSKRKCGLKGCLATHHRLLHRDKKPRTDGTSKAAVTEAKKEAQETVASSRTASSHAFLKIIPVRVIGPAGEADTYALLDDGSTVSLMDESIAQQVGAVGPIDPLRIGAIGDTTIDTPSSRRITVVLTSRLHHRQSPGVRFKARTISKLNLSPQAVSQEDVARCRHLQDLTSQLTYPTGVPQILVGQDNWHLLLATEIRRGPRDQPIASLTTLGWTLHGAHTRSLGHQVHYVNRHQTADTEQDADLNDQLREFFATKSLVVKSGRPASDPEKRAEAGVCLKAHTIVNGHQTVDTSSAVKSGRPASDLEKKAEAGVCLKAHTIVDGHQTVDARQDADLNDQLREFFAIESLVVNPGRPASDPEKRAEEILNRHTRQLGDGHIETAMLWRDENIEMPDSYETAFKRLVSIEKKLDKDPVLRARYAQQMDALIEKGYAEKAPKSSTPGRTWYLPHFDVFNPMKPEKLRIVHDAAAKSRGMSLNDFLLTGPDLLQSLPGVMMRFRRHCIAISGDIAEMFMQVKVRSQDRDSLRYLWRGSRREGAPEEYRMTSIIFGAASSPCIAIYAKNWNARRHIEKHPVAVKAIIENHYMDDYLDSYRTVEEATEVATAVKEIHQQARFDLRKWVSNSSRLIENIDPSQTYTEVVNIGDTAGTEKILGLIWRPSEDTLGFNLTLARLPQGILEKEAPTKREALKIVMSLYDPLGLASPITIRAKQILQEAWRRGVDWDQSLDEDLTSQWKNWVQHLQQLRAISIPRCYPGYSDATEIQIHVFTDASEMAYAAAVYWRATTAEGAQHVSLVMAKARVAPLKLQSIPRLELQAAVMGTRLAAAVTREHDSKPSSVTYWTDSKTVLSWLRKGARTYKAFVAHRIAAIEEGSKVEDWRWIPTKLNIADIATRDVPQKFDSQHEWYSGPRFLYEDPSSWPSEKPPIAEQTGEERTHTAVENKPISKLIEAIPDPTRFSRWERLLRATASVLRFIHLCKQKTERTFYKRTKKHAEEDPDWRKKKKTAAAAPKMSVKAPEVQKQVIEANFLQEAEKILVQVAQQQSFAQEMARLREQQVVDKNSPLHALQTEVVDGLLRIRSRIAATDEITEDVRRPPILHGDHHITQLYIDWTHRSLLHSGTELTINEVRQHYWVVRMRPTTKKVLSRCLQCRIRKAQAPVPATGDHPRTRLAHHQRPFTYTGLDYFGPLSVTVGRQRQKRYVALFTCLTTRAVHLEIAASLSADSAILALRRFAARRGCPTEIHSDNGTNMHGADRELREAFREEASRRGITWRFITPSAPFMGGAWERLVRCVKTALYTVLTEKHPHEEVLSTLICEAEYTVNSRPLTHVSVDGDDNESITPNHFLLGGSARLPCPGVFTEQDIDHKKMWRRSQILADMFWRRWVREYLPELQNRREPHSSGPGLQVGDPVLVADGQLPRNTWPRGRIEAIFPGPDGEVRTAEVRTTGGTLKRPVKKLIPLPK